MSQHAVVLLFAAHFVDQRVHCCGGPNYWPQLISAGQILFPWMRVVMELKERKVAQNPRGWLLIPIGNTVIDANVSSSSIYKLLFLRDLKQPHINNDNERFQLSCIVYSSPPPPQVFNHIIPLTRWRATH